MNLHWGIETFILVTISVAYLRYAVYIYDKYWSQGRQVATYLTLLLSTICFVLLMYIMNDNFNESRVEQTTPTTPTIHKPKGILV